MARRWNGCGFHRSHRLKETPDLAATRSGGATLKLAWVPAFARMPVVGKAMAGFLSRLDEVPDRPMVGLAWRYADVDRSSEK